MSKDRQIFVICDLAQLCKQRRPWAIDSTTKGRAAGKKRVGTAASAVGPARETGRHSNFPVELRSTDNNLML